MCMTPKVPSQQPMIDEQQRQFDIEQQRLQEQEAARQAEAERQRAAEEARAAEEQRLAQLAYDQEQARLAEAKLQQEREAAAAAAKQEAIAGGTSAVNSGFAGFDDDYFNSFREDYLGYYDPLVTRQAEDARRNAQFELARRGTLDSSAAADTFGRLKEAETAERARIGREAVSATDTFRSSINNSRANLLEQVVAAEGQGDFVSLTNSAVAGVNRPQFNDLGDLFSGLYATGGPNQNSTAADNRTLADPLASTGGDAGALIQQQEKQRKQAAVPTNPGMIS